MLNYVDKSDGQILAAETHKEIIELLRKGALDPLNSLEDFMDDVSDRAELDWFARPQGISENFRSFVDALVKAGLLEKLHDES